MTPETIAAAIEHGTKLSATHDHDGFKLAVSIPGDHKLVPLEPEKLERPRFLTAAPVFNDAGAFIAYVNDFKDEHSRIFYSMEGKFVAVLDHHENHNAISDDGGILFHAPTARHADHLAVLHLVRSPEWIAWSNASEKAMGQQAFAEFIEDNIRDLTDPDPETMMQVATGLHATNNSTFRQATNLANGEVQLQFDEQINGAVRGTQKDIPTSFQVGLRPFMGCDRYPVDCRLRYRIREGALALFYKALHLDPITEAALEQIARRIGEEAHIEPAMGLHDGSAVKRGA